MKTIRNWFTLFGVMLVINHSVDAQQISELRSLPTWSPQAKGAVIGAGTGAAAGAIIHKRNRAVGAVVGGVAGGAAGYAIGKHGRRWSPQAKGTAIGAGAGAAAGAIIHKRNRVVGGVVGGVAGGAAGYAIGKHIDNKRKRAARLAAEREAAERAAAVEEREELASGSLNRTYSVAGTAPTNRAKATQSGAPAPASLLAANTAPVPYVLPGGFLVNESYGDPTAPYGASEYRHKSW